MPADPYKYFRIEAHEILDQLGKGLLDLEKHGANPELVARLLRLAHTLKGAARIVKHARIADAAHAIEDALAPWRSDTAPSSRLDDALGLLDVMSAEVARLPVPEIAGTRIDVAEAPVLPRADTTAIDDVLSGLSELHSSVGRLRTTRDPALVVQRIDQLERELRAVRHDVERLRLVPLSTLFTPLERTARDAAKAAAKHVTFATIGGDARVDPHVLGTLHGALVQLVRNAVVHGLESPAARAAAHKPSEGRVTIEVRLQGTRVIVTCHDDGAGIAIEAVRRAAQRHAPTAERAAALDQEQLLELLLRGGLTTSPSITELSGRGIGLDVVRDAARQLGGTVAANTSAGHGTTFTIAVPVSVASIPALSVEAGGRTAVIPLDAVRRIVRVGPRDVMRSGDRLVVAIDDATVPYAPLAGLLGARDAARDHVHACVIVLEGAGSLAAIGVARTLGVETIVVRALPAGAPVDPVVWGIALDDEGHPRPVLEPAALVRAIEHAHVAAAPPVAAPLPILIVDDSLTTRMLEQSILESAGYDVDVASSAEEALDKTTRRSYALFLVDVEMPGMDGFGFIAEVRARRELASIPAILVTSRASPEDRRRGASVGAQGYIIKSEFDQVQLLGLIRGLVHA